jgi:hypothetical protein
MDYPFALAPNEESVWKREMTLKKWEAKRRRDRMLQFHRDKKAKAKKARQQEWEKFKEKSRQERYDS